MTIPYDSLLSSEPLRITRNRLLTRTVAPATEPVTLAEAKLYLRVDHSHEDTLINDLITAARMMAESWLSRTFITQTWKLAFDFAVADSIWLPMGPVSEVVSIVMVNQDGSTSTLDSSNYWLNAAKNAVVVNGIFSGFRVEITYNTGYGNAAAVPAPIKQGILSHIAFMYDFRGDYGENAIPDQALALYRPYREVRL